MAIVVTSLPNASRPSEKDHTDSLSTIPCWLVPVNTSLQCNLSIAYESREGICGLVCVLPPNHHLDDTSDKREHLAPPVLDAKMYCHARRQPGQTWPRDGVSPRQRIQEPSLYRTGTRGRKTRRLPFFRWPHQSPRFWSRPTSAPLERGRIFYCCVLVVDAAYSHPWFAAFGWACAVERRISGDDLPWGQRSWLYRVGRLLLFLIDSYCSNLAETVGYSRQGGGCKLCVESTTGNYSSWFNNVCGNIFWGDEK